MRALLVSLAMSAALWYGAGALALADATPAPAPAPTVPSLSPDLLNNPFVQSILNALGGILQTTNGPTAAGRVTYFHQYDLQLETGPRIFRDVHLHPGTVINPRGTTLTKGMLVVVNGSAQHDGSLNADTITVH
jgi:hypothetical protein